MISKCALSVLILVALSTTVSAQVKLERKYQAGDKYSKLAYTLVTQTLSIAGMDTETKSENNTTSQVTVGERDANGNLRVGEKVTALQISTAVQGSEYRFDSANPDKTGSSPLEFLRDLHKAMVDSVTTTVLDKNNRVAAVERDQDIVESLPAQVQTLVASQFDVDTLKDAVRQAQERLPAEPVKKGDTWTRTESANFGAGQVMTFETVYTYAGTVDEGGKRLDKITSKTTSVEFSLEDGSPLPLAVKGSDLKAAGADSYLLFDRKAGRIVKEKSSLHVTGGITFEANGMELPAELDLEIEAEVTIGT